MWSVGSSSLTRGRTQVPLHWEHGVLSPGPPGKSLEGPLVGPGFQLFPVLPSVPACSESTSSSWFAWGGWRCSACCPDGGPGYSFLPCGPHPLTPCLPLPNLGKWIAVSCFLLLAPSRSLLWVCSYLCFITALQWVFEMFRESLLNRKWGPSSHVFVCRAGLRPQRRYSVGATASGAGVGELRQAPCFSRTLSHAECPQRSCTGGGVLARHGQIRKIVKPGSLSASRGLT